MDGTVTGAGARLRPGRRWSMRTHLLGLAGAAIAVSALVGAVLTTRAYSSAERRAVAGARDAARQVAATLDRDVEQAATLTAVSAPSVRPVLDQAGAIANDPKLCTLTFSGVGVFPSEGAIHILTPDGRVLCSSAADALGKSYAGAPWFTRLAAGEPVTNGADADAVTGAPVVTVGVPVPGASGNLAGMLVTTLAARPLAPALADTFGGTFQRQFSVVGPDRQVFSSSIAPADAGRPFPDIADGETAADSRGTKRIWGAAPVSRTGWQIWSATSEAAALGPARAERNRLALVLVVALAAAVALALLVNRRLLRPVRELSRTVGAAETDTGARAAVVGPAELAELAAGLNHMLEVRQHNEQLVSELATELESTAISLVEAREQERRELAGALHDTTLQGLIAALWQIDAMGEPGGSPALDRLRDDLSTLVDQTRAVTTGLQPPALEEAGLGGAVDDLAYRASTWNLSVEVEDRLAGARFAVALEMLVYRAVQEALQNVRKHAQASKVHIVLEQQEDRLRATVIDDGVGIDLRTLEERARAGHLGVSSMRDTVRLAKGRFSIHKGDPAGTVVEVEVPVAGGGRLLTDS